MGPAPSEERINEFLRQKSLKRGLAALRQPSLGLVKGGVRANQTEVDYVDTTISGDADTTGFITHINVIPSGTSVNQRVGKKVALKSVQVRTMVFNKTTATSNVATILLVYDRHPAGALPAITDIIKTPVYPQALNNDNNSERFKILSRYVTTLFGTVAVPIGEGAIELYEKYVKLNTTRDCIFTTGTAGTIAEVTKGALYLVAYGNTAPGTAAVTVSGFTRVRYWDT